MKTTLLIALLTVSSMAHAETIINYDFDTGRHTVVDIDRSGRYSTSSTLGQPYPEPYIEPIIPSRGNWYQQGPGMLSSPYNPYRFSNK